jgi:hypothetical protein
VHQAPRVSRVQLLSDEVVSRRVAQVNDGIGHDGADVDQTGRTCLRRHRRRNGGRRGNVDHRGAHYADDSDDPSAARDHATSLQPVPLKTQEYWL